MNRDKVNQLLLAIYLGYLTTSKYFIYHNIELSFQLLLIPTLTILVISILTNYRSRDINKLPFAIIASTLLLFITQITLFNNAIVYSYLYDFIIYGAIPLFLLLYIKLLDKFFVYLAYISILNLVLLGWDPVNSYAITIDYMTYGYYVMLPIFVSLYISRKIYKIKWLLPFEMISLLLLVVYGNQGATASAIAIIFLTIALYDKNSFKKKILYSTLAIAVGVFFLNLNSILLLGIQYAREIGQSSYAIEKLYYSLDGSSSILSGREHYWQSASDMIIASPITGHGIGYFESINYIYSHNIFLEIAVSLGLLFLLIFIVYLMFYTAIALKSNRIDRLPYVLGIGLGLVPLLFSMQPFIWAYFWIFTLNPRLSIGPIIKILDNAKNRIG